MALGLAALAKLQLCSSSAFLNIGKQSANILRPVIAMHNDKGVLGVVQHTFH